MIYQLEELLVKMGAPEVREKDRAEWHYFDRDKKDIAGYACVRIDRATGALHAELRHVRRDYEDDHGNVHAAFTETFHLHAEHVAAGRYRILSIGFDGESHDAPQRAVVELGLGIFHARALDISILMVEQAFNKQDITGGLSLPSAPRARGGGGAIFARAEAAARLQKQQSERAAFGTVIPFPARAGLR